MREIGAGAGRMSSNGGRSRRMKRPHLDPQQRRLLGMQLRHCRRAGAGDPRLQVLGHRPQGAGPSADDRRHRSGPRRRAGSRRRPRCSSTSFPGTPACSSSMASNCRPSIPTTSAVRPTRAHRQVARAAGLVAGNDDLRARQRHADVRADQGRADRVVHTGHAHRDGDLLEDPRIAPAVAVVHLDVLGLLNAQAGKLAGGQQLVEPVVVEDRQPERLAPW